MLRIERHADHGPVVTLLHELGGNAGTFRWLVPHLAGLRTLAIDLPGTRGSSPVPEDATIPDIAASVAQALDVERIGPSVVVGVAGGAGVAAALAANRPDLCRALVYVSLGATIDSATAAYIRNRVPVVREHGMERVTDASLARSYPESLRASTGSVFAEYRAEFVASDIDGYITQGLALAACGADLGTYLSMVRAPTVVVGGSADELFPPPTIDSAAARAAHLIARVQLPGVAHLPHLQAPMALAGAITLAAGCAAS
jgi:pimeloyl-ACP methyl ester carboxylesterase